MNKSHNPKTYNRLRFAGASALILSVVGVLMAIGGQLDFIGQERPENINTQKAKVDNGVQPKYSFYEDLKKRKTELDNSPATSDTVATKQKSTTKNTEKFNYLVQIGSFKHKKDAEKTRKQAQALGFKVNVVKRKSRYVTQAGPFGGLTASKKAETKLQAAKLPTLIRRIK